MSTYIILNGNRIVAYTTKKWLLKLFLYNRKNVSSFNIRKVKDSEFELMQEKLRGLQIHYFYTYALTDDELEYIDFIRGLDMTVEKLERLQKKYDTKRTREFVDQYKKIDFEYRISLAHKCISNPGLVREGLDQKNFFESLKEV